MKYNTRKWNPWLISLPDIGIGMFWTLSGNIGSWIIYTHTKSAFEVSLVISMSAFTGIFVQILSGMISDRTQSKFGKRTPWILFGLVMACFFQMMWAFASSYIVLFFIAFMTYFFVNFYQGPYYSMIVESVEKDQVGLATMLARTTAQIGTIIVGGLAAWVWSKGQISACLFICLLLFVPTIIVIPFIIKEKKENYTVSTYQFKFDIFKDKAINKVFISTTCFLFAFGAFMPMMGSYMNNHLGFSKEFTSHLVMIYGIGCVIVGIFSTIFLSKIKQNYVFIAGLTLFAIGLLIGCFCHTENKIFYLIAFIVSAGFILCQFGSYVLIAQLAPQQRLGEYMGWLNLFFSLPQFVIMLGGGYLVDLGLGNYIYPIAVIILIIGICNLIGFKKLVGNRLDIDTSTL